MPSNDGHQLNCCRPTLRSFSTHGSGSHGTGRRLRPPGREMLPEKARCENFRRNLNHLMYKRLLDSLLPPVTPAAGAGRKDLRGDAQCQLARRAALTSRLEKSSAGPADRRCWKHCRLRTQRLRLIPSTVRPVANPHLREPDSVEVAAVRQGPRNSRRPTWWALRRPQLPQHRGRSSSRRRQQHSRTYQPLVHNRRQLFRPHSTNHSSRTHQQLARRQSGRRQSTHRRSKRRQSPHRHSRAQQPRGQSSKVTNLRLPMPVIGRLRSNRLRSNRLRSSRLRLANLDRRHATARRRSRARRI
jgi:hypothetical protein